MFPDFIEISESGKDIIKKLLNKDLKQRLGFKNGWNEIIKH